MNFARAASRSSSWWCSSRYWGMSRQPAFAVSLYAQMHEKEKGRALCNNPCFSAIGQRQLFKAVEVLRRPFSSLPLFALSGLEAVSLLRRPPSCLPDGVVLLLRWTREVDDRVATERG